MTFTPEQLQERTLHRRAIEAAIWGMPAVNYDAMYQALVRDAKGAPNQIVYWSRLLDWKNQTLTPNPDAIYLMPFYDTTERTRGPRNPACRRRFDHRLHRRRLAVRDRRRRSGGYDAGKGGKYLILPPDYRGLGSRRLYLHDSPTYCGYALLRSNLDERQRLRHRRRRRLRQAGQVLSAGSGDERRTTTFVDAADVLFDATIPYDATFFEALDRRVQAEPWLTRDKAMIDTLKTDRHREGQTLHARTPPPRTTLVRSHAGSARLARRPIRGRSSRNVLRQRPMGVAGVTRARRRDHDRLQPIPTPTPSTTEGSPIPGRSSAPNRWVPASTT